MPLTSWFSSSSPSPSHPPKDPKQPIYSTTPRSTFGPQTPAQHPLEDVALMHSSGNVRSAPIPEPRFVHLPRNTSSLQSSLTSASGSGSGSGSGSMTQTSGSGSGLGEGEGEVLDSEEDSSEGLPPGAKLFLGGVAFSALSLLITRRALTRRNKPIISALKEQASGAASSSASTRAPSSKAPFASPSALKAEGIVKKEGPLYKAHPASRSAQVSEAQTPQPISNTTQASPATDTTLEQSPSLLAVEALTLATLNVISLAIAATGGILWYFEIGSMEDLRRKVRGGLGVDGSGRSEREVEEEMEEWMARALSRGEERRRRREGGSVEGGS